MVFVTVQFDYGGNTSYKRLLDVFVKSINATMPEAEVKSICIPAPRIQSFKRGMTSNTEKLKIWVNELENFPEGEHIIFADCDMLAVKDISDIWEKDFDIAVTERKHSHYRWNGGIVFVKNNERSREFFRLWLKINMEMYTNYRMHEPWRRKYAGMNQAAFGYVMEKEKFRAKLINVPCLIWNCCNEDWGRIDPDTRLIHIKGGLRKACLNLMRVNPSLVNIVNMWRQYSMFDKGDYIQNMLQASPTYEVINQTAVNKYIARRKKRDGDRNKKTPGGLLDAHFLNIV